MKNFKNYCAFITVISCLLFFTSCQKSEDEPSLSVSPSRLTFTAEEKGEQTIMVDTDANWTYNISSSWVDAYRKSDNKLYVTVSKNEDTNNSRSATITIIAGNKKKAMADVVVEQQKLIINNLSVNPTELTYKYNETGDKTAIITTDASGWDFTKSADWMTVTKQNNTLTVSISTTNTGSADRTAGIIVTAGNAAPVTVTVSQEIQNTLSVSPTELNFGASETSSKEVTITTNASGWDFNNPADWLTITKSGNKLIVNPKSQNTASSSRTANVKITAGSASEKTIIVKQEGRNTLSVNPAELVFASTEISNTKSVEITTNASGWNYSNTAGWLTITKNGNRLDIRPSSNNTTVSARETLITVTAGTATEQTIKVIQNGQQNTLTVSPATLSFGATETSNKQVTITTNASSWDYTTSVSWLTLSKSGSLLYVRPLQNTSSSSRTATITVTAGTASARTITVTQAGTSGQPISGNYNYSATSILLWDNASHKNSSWTGQIRPNSSSSEPYIAISNFGGAGVTVYCDYIGGTYRLDVTTAVLEDADGDLGYLCMGTVNSSTGEYKVYPGVNYNISYNATTNVLDFSGTYNGLPTFITIVPKDKNTGQWLDQYFYFNEYRNLKLQLTTTLSAPLQDNNEQVKTNTKVLDLNVSKGFNNFIKIKENPYIKKKK